MAIEAVEEAGAARESEVCQSLQEIERRYASRDRTYWAKRFGDALSGRGEPLRILTAVSIHTTFLQYSMRDAIAAFEALGDTRQRLFGLVTKIPKELKRRITFIAGKSLTSGKGSLSEAANVFCEN